MDRRRLKKGPSLLGKVDSGMSRSDDKRNNDEVVQEKRATLRSSNVKSKSPELSQRNSNNGTPIKLRSTGGGKRTSTPVTTDKETSSDESEENEIFITKRRGANKSLNSSRNFSQQSKTVESKRKRLVSSSSETDFHQSPKSKKIISDKKKSQANKSQEKLNSANKKSSSKLSPNSSITQYSSDENTDKGDEENDENRKEFNTKRASGRSDKSPNIHSSNKKNKKRARSSSSSERNSVTNESTDDDMFDEAVPAKSTPIAAPASKKKPVDSSPLKASRNRSGSGSHALKKSPQHSRVTSSQSAKKSPPMRKTNNHLIKFLKEAGIILGKDGPNSFSYNRHKIISNLNKLLSSEKYDKDNIIREWQQYIDKVENLQSVLCQTVNNDQEALIDENTESVARILLHVPILQTEISVSLLDRLAMAILVEDSPDDVPWSGLLLRQFKFLEQIVDPNTIIAKLGELLESAQKCFQSEIISYLPDIVVDSQHHAIGEILTNLLDDNTELTAVILDCMSRLTLSKDYLEIVKEKALDLLKHNPKLSTLPATARFILGESSTPEARVKALMVLRAVDMQPLAGENLEEFFTNQVLIVNALKTSNQVSKQIADAAFAVVQRVKKDPKPLDLIMLLLIFHSNSAKKRNVEALLKSKIHSGFYRPSLLDKFYHDYKEVARGLQPTAILLASHLLKAGDRVYANFAIEWFRLLFLSQAEAIHKQQEVLAKIIKLTGAGTETSKNALAILSNMANNDDEKEQLQKHSHHLRTLLEEVDELDLEEVATVSDLLHGLCVGSNSASDALQADLDIVLSKQLAGSKPVTKCKGVLGALMAIKHAAAYPRTRQRALELFEQVVNAVKTCPRSRALFYDQMAEVVANTKNLDENFLDVFTEHFTSELCSIYLVDIKDYSGPLSAQYSLNSEVESSPKTEYAVNFGEGNNGSAVSALFRLLKTCHMRKGVGDLSPIDALLGCPVLMSKDLHDPDSAVLDQIFHCINWFRELISGFVNQTDDNVQKILPKRLDNLMTLQAELSMNLTMAASHYQPPVCYFHHFPSPPFIKIEKKSGKRGNKSTLETSNSLSEWASWESGFALVSKNPAYFRHLDAKIAYLLDCSMEVRLTQSRPNSITIAQVCFIIKELLGMLENEVSQTFMKDLVNLLPKVCAKLEQVTNELRDKDDSQNRECFRLLLSLLASIFNWKGFQNYVNNPLLREALRVVAGQTNEANTLLRSCKELVTQSYSYVESLTDIVTRLPVAITLVNLLQNLIQYSGSLAQQYKGNLAKTAFGFLCLDWHDDKSNALTYKAAIKILLKSWLTNEPDPLDTVVTLLEWLPEEAKKLARPQDSLARILSINKSTFSLFFKQIFVGLIDGVKISLNLVKRDSERIKIWNSVTTGVHRIVKTCNMVELKANYVMFLQYIPVLLKLFISLGMPILEHNLKYHVEEVTGIVKQLQEGTRYLHALCCESTGTGDMALAKFVPVAKSTLEKLNFSVKGMLVLNNSPEAFWMGNLINKDTKGKRIEDEQNTEESTSVSVNSIQTDVSEELITDVSEEESMDEEIE